MQLDRPAPDNMSAPAYRVLVQEGEIITPRLKDRDNGVAWHLFKSHNTFIVSGAGTRAIGIVSRGFAGFNHRHNTRLYYRRSTADVPVKV